MLKIVKKIRTIVRSINRAEQLFTRELMLTGRLLAHRSRSIGRIDSFSEVEFSAFSQFGDDGIIQWLIGNINFPHQTFVEFGVEDYLESNTRFLLLNNNWRGFVMDGSDENVGAIKSSEAYWRHDLEAVAAFIDAENINHLLSSSGLGRNIGLLHIDLDGNDYWIWKAINTIEPIVIIVEYNSVFGSERAITVPYDKEFRRNVAHHSNLYWGASLGALKYLAETKGYGFIGCNSAGNNAYFVHKDWLNDVVHEVSLPDGFISSKYRESRDSNGKLTYLRGASRFDAIKGMMVYNVKTNQLEQL